MRKIIIIILLVFVSLPAYSQDKFVPGEVVIIFNSSIEGPDALVILKEYDLELDKVVISRLSYHFISLDNEPHLLKIKLEQSQLFNDVGIRLTEYGDISNILYANTNLKTTRNDVVSFVDSIENVKIDEVFKSSIMVLVKVPKGHELTYVKKLNKNIKIESVELNVIDETF